jgi:hypothetical protein
MNMKWTSACTVCAILACISLMIAGGSESEEQRQRATLSDLCSMATAIERFAVDHGEFPAAGTIDALDKPLVPRYLDRLPRQDGWGNEFSVDVEPTQYTIASCGKGAAGGCTPALTGNGGATTDPQDDIILANHVYLQWPKGLPTRCE